MALSRRRFLELAAAPLLLSGCPVSFEQGFLNACRNPKAGNLSSHPAVRAAWEGLRADRVWDVHAHIFGNGRAEKGVWIDPHFDQGGGPASRIKRKFFLNSACAGDDESNLDRAMVARLTQLVDDLPVGAKVMVLAFDFTYDESGKRRDDQTTFSVDNAYAQRVAQSRPDRFEWTCSVHPYREDVVEALNAAKAGGARAVKWLPPTMAIDLTSARCNAAYDAMVRLDLPLLVHLGEEEAVAGALRKDLVNPLSARTPLDRGVRVIVAHCASLGKGNFEAFESLMTERQYQGRLFGDISAVTQANRPGIPARILAHEDWDGRLLNGTDYPLPAMLPLFSPNSLAKEGLIAETLVPVLRDLRETNPLLFDFVLKRHLSLKGRKFPAATFETRDFFTSSSRPSASTSSRTSASTTSSSRPPGGNEPGSNS
jgi:predicted TIM-barrel fold metal-dependent hydrolase